MSYCIYYNFGEKIEDKDYENISWDEFGCNDDLLIKTEQFGYFYEDYVEIRNKKCETEDEHKLGLIDEFKETESFYELKDCFMPMMNFVHILQGEPSREQIMLVEKYASVCTIVKIEELNIYGLALTGGGMDLSEYIELAYYLTDGISPVTVSKVVSLGKKEKSLLEFCRKTVKKENRVNLHQIEKFLGK